MDFDNDFFIQAQGVIERTFRAARPELLELHGNVKVDFKSDNTPVTALDKKIEEQLREALRNFDSSIGFEGEEFGIEGNRETFWLIDPIDGTEYFIRGLPLVANMVTLIDGGRPVFAQVYKPITDELFVAAENEGAYRNGLPIKVSERPLSRAWIDLSMALKDDNLPVITAVREKIMGFRALGDFTYVARGMIDGQLVYGAGGGPWDYAPRALLIKEAGGIVQNIGSEDYDYRINDMLAANPAIFKTLMDVINKALA